MTQPSLAIWFERSDEQQRVIGCFEGMGCRGFMPAEGIQAFADAQMEKGVAIVWYMRRLCSETRCRIVLTRDGQKARLPNGKLRFVLAKSSLFTRETAKDRDEAGDQPMHVVGPIGERPIAAPDNNGQSRSKHDFGRYRSVARPRRPSA